MPFVRGREVADRSALPLAKTGGPALNRYELHRVQMSLHRVAEGPPPKGPQDIQVPTMLHTDKGPDKRLVSLVPL